MTHEEAFLQDILERPDDDARLIFADWLEDNGDPDRAEFIRVQMADRAPHGARGHRYPARADELLLRNWDRWVAPLARLVNPDGADPYLPWLREGPNLSVAKALPNYPRGFVSELTMAADRLVANGEAILRLAALTRLRLHGAGGLGAKLAGCPALRWVREIGFIDYFRAPVGAEDMAALAASPHLGRLTALRLHRNNLGNDGARALAGAAWLTGIEYLDLTDNGLSTAGLSALVDRRDLRNLRVLRLDHNGLDAWAVSLLLDSPWLDQLEFLSLRNAGISPHQADEIAARAPRLRVSIG
ncbi:MAG: TIGR02996 domain-containing protein [Gemmataceae bacterium]